MFRLVELGPGRGTLANDIVQTFQHFRQKIFGTTRMSFHFVEVSETLSKIQFNNLCGKRLDWNEVGGDWESNVKEECYQSGMSKFGDIEMHWHRDLDSVPDDGFTFFLAHEFFDALPIHKFVQTDKGWREIYVDVKPGSDNTLHFTQLPEATLATKLIKVC